MLSIPPIANLQPLRWRFRCASVPSGTVCPVRVFVFVSATVSSGGPPSAGFLLVALRRAGGPGFAVAAGLGVAAARTGAGRAVVVIMARCRRRCVGGCGLRG